MYHGHMLLVTLMVKNVLYKKLQKTDQTEFKVQKITKKTSDKLYVKWKGYDNSFNS